MTQGDRAGIDGILAHPKLKLLDQVQKVMRLEHCFIPAEARITTSRQLPLQTRDPSERLVSFQQIQQFSVELMALPVLVIDVLASRVQDSEIAAKVPQGVPDLVAG